MFWFAVYYVYAGIAYQGIKPYPHGANARIQALLFGGLLYPIKVLQRLAGEE